MADIDPKSVKWDAPQLDPNVVKWDDRTNRVAPLIRTMQSDYGQGVAKFATEAGGRVVDYLSEKLGAGSPLAAGAGTATKLLLGDIPPMVMSAQAGATAVEPLAQGTAKWLMQGALKPSAKNLASGRADKAVTTLLEHGVPVSKSGIETLKGKIGNLESKIQSVLADSPGVVDKYAVGTALGDLVKKTQTNLSAADDVVAIQDTLTKFLNHPLLNNSSTIPVSLANKIKQSIYASVGESAYGLGAKPAIQIAAEKGIASGLRRQTALAEPAVVPLLEDQAALVNALKVMQPRAMMQGNVNPLGLGLLASDPRAALAFAVDRNAPIRSWLAGQLYRGAAPAAGALTTTQPVQGVLSGAHSK